jgi:hypothetical protein
MRGRERLFGTAAIWIAVAVMMNNLMDRFIQVRADFSGLWPPLQYTFTQLPDASGVVSDAPSLTVAELERVANTVGTQIFSEVNNVVARQMSANIPIMVILALALILAATVSTYFVWRNAHLEADAPARSKSTVKAKRGSRVEQVVNALDEDEIAELRTRLMDDHSGEAIPLEELLVNRR